MKWFNNLKIGVKLIIGFSIVAIIAGVVGYVGLNGLKKMEVSVENIGLNNLPSIQELAIINEAQTAVKAAERTIYSQPMDSATYKKETANIESAYTRADEAMAIYEKLSKTKEEGALWKEFSAEWETWQSDQTTFVTMATNLQNIDPNNTEAINVAVEKMKKQTLTVASNSFTIVDDSLAELIEINKVGAAAENRAAAAVSSSATRLLVLITIIGLALAMALGIFISKIISTPIKKLTKAAGNMALGDLNIKLNIDSKDEVGILAQALGKVVIAINNLTMDANMLVQATVEGKLSTRADASKHDGDYRKIIEGVNNTLDAVIAPITEASSVLEEMSKGNLQVKVSGTYLGDNAKLKNDLNSTIVTLSSYISEISTVLTQIGDGNLDLSITADYRGDFVEIKNALNNIIQSLNENMSAINEASKQVAAGSSQISYSSTALSQGATEQASSVEELTASIEEVSSQTELNAKNANQASDLSESAKMNAVQGNSQMKEMLKAMEDINNSSANISKIIKVIDDIAFQTNMLALNAAVEAARAGQHGKGFAVVAEEVKNLAARSANAAKETTEMIEGSIVKSEAGTKIAKDTAEALEKIVNQIDQAATLVSDIAIASNEQAQGIGQINQGIMQVSQVIQANSATSEESAAASEQLSSQAELLKEQVSKFKLKENNATYNRYDEISPEVLKMLDNMTKKNSIDNKNKVNQDTNSSKPNIVLSDNEFGKY